MVFLQVLDILWSLESLPIQGLQVIATLFGVMDDPVRSFPCGTELSLGGVFSCYDDLPQDEVSYVKSSELHSLVVVLSHLLLIFCHLIGGPLFDFVYTIQVDS